MLELVETGEPQHRQFVRRQQRTDDDRRDQQAPQQQPQARAAGTRAATAVAQSRQLRSPTRKAVPNSTSRWKPIDLEALAHRVGQRQVLGLLAQRENARLRHGRVLRPRRGCVPGHCRSGSWPASSSRRSRSRRPAGFGERGEIHRGGDVLQARPGEDVVVDHGWRWNARRVPSCAAAGSTRARMAVIDEQQRAVAAARRRPPAPSTAVAAAVRSDSRRRMAPRSWRSTWRTAAASSASAGRSLRMKRPSPSSATCSSNTSPSRRLKRGVGSASITSLANSTPFHGLLRRCVEPFDQVEQQRMAGVRCRRSRWRCAQVGAGFEDRVARGQRIAAPAVSSARPRRRRRCRRRARRIPPPARVAAAPAPRRRRRSAANSGPEFRRGDEIAGRAELGRARAVVAQPRCVQAQLHEARERNRAAGGEDLFLDDLAQVRAVGLCIDVGSGARRRGHGSTTRREIGSLRRHSAWIAVCGHGVVIPGMTANQPLPVKTDSSLCSEWHELDGHDTPPRRPGHRRRPPHRRGDRAPAACRRLRLAIALPRFGQRHAGARRRTAGARARTAC